MGTKTNTGFTIIETMLFFAVAGVLAAGIFAGSSVSINQQRYKDSVNSLKSFIQQQYSETTNASSDRAGVESCSASAVVLQAPASGQSEARGTSECILLGRLITIDNTGTKLTASNVVGYRTPRAAEEISDILEIKKNYKLGISPIGQEKSEVAWSAVIVKKQTTQPTAVSILILRSPLSGSIMTYASQGTVSNLQSMITLANSNKSTELCVNPASGTLQDRRMAVQISPFASSQGAIQVPLESSNVCD
jgi:type II secretory pathway pseudopilin PulG